MNDKLDAAKTVAEDWINNLAPEVSASIPAQIIDYGATFSASVNAIHTLYDQDPTGSGTDNATVLQVKAIMENLSTEVGKRQTVVTDMQSKLTTWGTDMQTAHDDLVTGATNIQSTIVDLKTDIENMDNAIANNRAAIEKMNKDLIYAQVAVGVGVFMLVAGVALTIATAGTAAVVSGGIAAVGASSIIAGAVTWGIIQGEINDDYDSIADEQKQKSADEQQVVALQGLSSASNAVVSAIEISTSTLSDFETTWKLFGDELQGVIDKLDSGSAMSSIIMEKVMTDAAKNEWDDAVELAKELAGATVTVETQDITPESVAA